MSPISLRQRVNLVPKYDWSYPYRISAAGHEILSISAQSYGLKVIIYDPLVSVFSIEGEGAYGSSLCEIPDN